MLKTIFENIISVITVVCCRNGATEVHNKMLQQTESALQTYVLQRWHCCRVNEQQNLSVSLCNVINTAADVTDRQTDIDPEIVLVVVCWAVALDNCEAGRLDAKVQLRPTDT